jgi:AcrR family transcriptional regulator
MNIHIGDEMPTAKLQTDIRQEQILHAALHVVASHGLHGLTMQRVAQQVGLAPSAIYRHFQNKDEVLVAILAFIQDRLLGNVRTVSEEIADPMERLHRLLQRQVRLLMENPAIPRVVFSEEVYQGYPERQAVVYGIIRRYLERVRHVMWQGQQTRHIRADVTPETLALMFLGLIQSAVFLWHISGGTFGMVEHTERAWRVFSQAMRVR